MPYREPITDDNYSILKLDKLIHRRLYASACYGYKLFNGLLPNLTSSFRPIFNEVPYSLRQPSLHLPEEPAVPTLRYKRSPMNTIIALLNKLNPALVSLDSLEDFRKAVKLIKHKIDEFWILFTRMMNIVN